MIKKTRDYINPLHGYIFTLIAAREESLNYR